VIRLDWIGAGSGLRSSPVQRAEKVRSSSIFTINGLAHTYLGLVMDPNRVLQSNPLQSSPNSLQSKRITVCALALCCVLSYVVVAGGDFPSPPLLRSLESKPALEAPGFKLSQSARCEPINFDGDSETVSRHSRQMR